MYYIFVFLSLIQIGFARECFKSDFFGPYARAARAHHTDVGYQITVINTKTLRYECSQSFEADKVIYPASAMKVFVVAAIFRLVDAGKLKLDQPVVIDQSNANAEGEYRYGAQVRLSDLLRSCIVDSNNTATNQLIDVASKSYINRTARDFGLRRTKIVRKVYGGVDPEPEITERNGTTASDLTRFYTTLYFNNGKILSEKSRHLFLHLLKATKHNNRFNFHFQKKHTFWHKTGSTSKNASDAGFLIIKDKLIVLSGLQESPASIPAGKRWDFALLAKMGKEVISKIGSKFL